MALTDIAVRRANTAGKYADGRGLYLHVAPAGGKYWRYAYRFNAKQKTLALGTYPDISLAKAREIHQAARSQLAAGTDPGEVKKARKAATVNTFEALAAAWLERQNVKDITRERLSLWLKRDCAPLSTMAVTSIGARDILNVARIAEATSADRARRIVSLCGQVIRFGVATGVADRDPTGDLRGALAAPPRGNFTALTDPTDLARLMQAIHVHAGHPLTIAALKLSALTFTRPGELRTALWTEIDGDTWTIAGTRMKMGRDHIVPLSLQALEVLASLPRSSIYLLPMQTNAERPMAANTVSDAIRRMGFAHTAHGFRASARTILDEVLGERVDLIEHQLAHAVKDPNGRSYNRTAHLPARRAMMQRWADYLDKLRMGTEVPARPTPDAGR